jgi:hypothetical protein
VRHARLVSTSIADELGRTAEAPSTAAVERAARILAPAFANALGADIDWTSREGLEAAVGTNPAAVTAATAAGAPATADDLALTPVA